MNKLSLTEIDAALARRDELPADDEALLWFTRAELMGIAPSAEYLVLLMGVSQDQASDIVARLSERGFIES
jgi:hypothetical protein